MDSVRHFLAVFELVVLPPAACFWLVIHPYSPWWRTVGPPRTYLTLVHCFGCGERVALPNPGTPHRAGPRHELELDRDLVRIFRRDDGA
jgi:hypothetical protein